MRTRLVRLTECGYRATFVREDGAGRTWDVQVQIYPAGSVNKKKCWQQWGAPKEVLSQNMHAIECFMQNPNHPFLRNVERL